MENKLRNNMHELQKRDKIISELEAQVEETKIRNDYQAQIEEISFPVLKTKLDSNKKIYS